MSELRAKLERRRSLNGETKVSHVPIPIAHDNGNQTNHSIMSTSESNPFDEPPITESPSKELSWFQKAKATHDVRVNRMNPASSARNGHVAQNINSSLLKESTTTDTIVEVSHEHIPNTVENISEELNADVRSDDSASDEHIDAINVDQIDLTTTPSLEEPTVPSTISNSSIQSEPVQALSSDKQGESQPTDNDMDVAHARNIDPDDAIIHGNDMDPTHHDISNDTDINHEDAFFIINRPVILGSKSPETPSRKPVTSSAEDNELWDDILAHRDSFLADFNDISDIAIASSTSTPSSNMIHVHDIPTSQASELHDDHVIATSMSPTISHKPQPTTIKNEELWEEVHVNKELWSANDDKSHEEHLSDDPLQLKLQVAFLTAELKRRDAHITSLEGTIASLKRELELKSKSHDPRETSTDEADENMISHSHDHSHAKAQPHKSIFHQRLKRYGFDVSDESMADYLASMNAASDRLDHNSNGGIDKDHLISHHDSSSSSDYSLTPATLSKDVVVGTQLTPSATKQLNDLLSIDASAAASGTPRSHFSQRYSVDLTSQRLLSSSSISMLSREPSQRFLDPLTAIAIAEVEESQAIDHDEELRDDVAKNHDENRNSITSTDSVKPGNHKDVIVDPEEMTYKEFVDRMLREDCNVIVQHTRKFLLSVMGPGLDGKPPPRRAKVDYVFYGTKQLEKRCRDFFDDIQINIRDHSLWKDESEERVISSRDCLETYVMTRLHALAFAAVERKKDDEALLRRMKLLSFITPQNLDMKAELCEEELWIPAINELKKIDQWLSPGDKIDAVVKCTTVIFKSIEAAGMKAQQKLNDEKHNGEVEEHICGEALGADDFLPVFILVVLRSQLTHLYSNCAYIQAFLNPIRLMSKKGYCLVNLQSALEFLMNLDNEALNMDASAFKQQIQAAEKLL